MTMPRVGANRRCFLKSSTAVVALPALESAEIVLWKVLPGTA